MTRLEELTIEQLTAYLRGAESVCKKYENEQYLNPSKQKEFRIFGGIKEKIIFELEKRLTDLC